MKHHQQNIVRVHLPSARAYVDALDELPRESWWLCPAAEFYERALRELPRMRTTRVVPTIRSSIDGVLP